jgi:hypothetical protein
MRDFRCPDCYSAINVPIHYGEPSSEVLRKAEAGELALALCPEWTSGPDRMCTECGSKFYTDRKAKAAADAEKARQLGWLAAMKRISRAETLTKRYYFEDEPLVPGDIDRHGRPWRPRYRSLTERPARGRSRKPRAT